MSGSSPYTPKPPFNEQPHGDNGRHTDAWAGYHQRMSDRVSDLPTEIRTGTTTNDDATAGMIGEYFLSEITTGIPASSGISMNVTSLPLTAGDWVCGGNVVTAPAGGTSTTSLQAAVSTVSGSLPAPNGGAFAALGAAGAGRTLGLPTGTRRFSLAATTTVFLSANVIFSGGTMDVYGSLWARRVR